jgi:hypothetical protein
VSRVRCRGGWQYTELGDQLSDDGREQGRTSVDADGPVGQLNATTRAAHPSPTVPWGQSGLARDGRPAEPFTEVSGRRVAEKLLAWWSWRPLVVKSSKY